MSDQIEEFDDVFRDRLSGQIAAPPPVVWENIQSTRSFGHVVANKISTNWGMFGNLLLLLLAGGSGVMLSEEENTLLANENSAVPNFHLQTSVVHEVESLQQKQYALKGTIEFEKAVQSLIAFQNAKNIESNEGERRETNLPAGDLVASAFLAGFSKPTLPANSRISAYLESLSGWETAAPKSFVRYYNMDKTPSKSAYEINLEKLPISINLKEYDYVMPRVKRKTFKERSSILLSFTPQSVKKIMVAEYNLSSSYLVMREKTERTRLAYTFGAMLHYELKNHKFLEGGINFSQIYEEMHYEGEKRFSNQYDFLEVPILFGYGDRNAKWGWEVKGGLGVQVYNSYKGYILERLDEIGSTPTQDQFLRRSNVESVNNLINGNHRLSENQARHEVLDLENDEENPFKNTGVVNLHLSTGLVYYHSITTSFVITPSYRRSLNSITKESALFKEKIRYTGISFGARMKF